MRSGRGICQAIGNEGNNGTGWDLMGKNKQGMKHGAGPGGEGGIRTHGNLAATHALQACLLDHSSTSPYQLKKIRVTLAERAGFEPALRKAEAAFRERYHKPLGHLSKNSRRTKKIKADCPNSGQISEIFSLTVLL
jgi:hypothetical protein